MYNIFLFKLNLMRMGDCDLSQLKYLCYDRDQEVDAIFAEIHRREAL